MATANFTSSTYLDTWGNGSTNIASSQNGYMGQANSSDNYRFTTAYTLNAPSFTGNSSSITVKATVKNLDSSSLPNKTWKCGISSSANTTYQNAYNTTYGAWTDSVTATVAGNGTATLTFTIPTNSIVSGQKYYFYFYSGAAEYNTVKLTGVTATLTYATETVTGTNLVIGTVSSPGSTTAYPTPSKKTVYWKVTGLQYTVKEYTGFHLYLSSGLTFTQGQQTAPTGTKITTYSSTTSTAKEFTQSFTVPNSNFKIGAKTGVVCIAQNASGYYRIGGSSNSPKVCYVHPEPSSWFQDVIDVNIKATGKTTATATITVRAANSPRYLSYVRLGTSSSNKPSETGTSTAPSYTGSATITTSTASTQTKTISITGLTAGTKQTRYPFAYASTSYAAYRYYGLGTSTFYTDANYSATIKSTVNGTSNATIIVSSLNSEINLDGNFYLVSTNQGDAITSLTGAVSFERSGRTGSTIVSLGGNPCTSFTYYIYVKSEVSGFYYLLGSVTDKSHGYIYYAKPGTGEGSIYKYTTEEELLEIQNDRQVYYTTSIEGNTYYLLSTGLPAGEEITITVNDSGVICDKLDVQTTAPSGINLSYLDFLLVQSEKATLIPCYTYMLDEDSGELIQVLLDVKNSYVSIDTTF